MFHIITGGSGSGKSAYAEDCIIRYYGENSEKTLYYIATMEPYGKEMEKKIERHRNMRAGKGFQTIECYSDLKNAVSQIAEYGSCVLLECMSNLVANEFYKKVLKAEQKKETLDPKTEEQVVQKIWADIQLLLEKCDSLVVVTNEVCSVFEVVSEEMIRYKKILSSVNCKMAVYADKVTEVVYGIPVEMGERR